MTMDVMGLTMEDFVDGIEVGGAVTFLEFAKDAAPTLTFLIAMKLGGDISPKKFSKK